ncbi:MAG: UDP-N-acetylmuramate--L-alanine ligase [Chroococcopsis gigantea SAG 12.99]|nr:UDP-N-acetylmuramate--L-alanine ligase [Chroococcopsis gigantea SAG 12.99]
MKTVDFNGKPFHFIGIGGIGMSALAYVLAKRHLPVSGSDLRSSHITQRLQSAGAQIFNGQDASNFQGFGANLPLLNQDKKSSTPQVICSTAINANNSEYRAAKELGYPIFHRSDVLAALIKDYDSIAVAGTHGKTTTSSLIGYLLLEAGLDPTIIVGGEVDAWEGNARLGEGQFLVAEADESDGSLTKHSPKIGVITNIELDHPDHYESLDEVIDTFTTFASQCEVLVGCWDCETIRDRFQPTLTYSLNPDSGADYTVTEIQSRPQGLSAAVWERGKLLGQLTIGIPGVHNISNALAAVAVARYLGVDFATIASALASFQGAKRRFEYKGEANGVTFVDDYAHHPSELRVTLAAAQLKVQQQQYRRVIAIFQPHRYTRTATFLEDFGTSFAGADVVVLTDIYSAGEINVHLLTGQRVADEVSRHHEQVFYHPELSSLGLFLSQILQPGDLALFLGAGNLNQIIPEMLGRYNLTGSKIA